LSVRLASAQGLAETFAKWQSFISTPDLDRRFASILTVSPVGIVIAGDFLCCCPCQLFHIYILFSGTYFGTRVEYDALNVEAQLGSGSLIKVDIIDDWLGTVLNWAAEVVGDVVGGVVSSSNYKQKLYLLRSHSHFILIAHLFLRKES
jgi:hypothetical protein